MCHAFGDENIKFNDLHEFIQRIEDNKIDGIVDMLKNPKDCDNEYQLLNSSIDILKSHLLKPVFCYFLKGSYYNTGQILLFHSCRYKYPLLMSNNMPLLHIWFSALLLYEIAPSVKSI